MADFPLNHTAHGRAGFWMRCSRSACATVAYLAGDVTEEPWLNEPQGLGAWMTCIAPPDKSFAIGGNHMAGFSTCRFDRFRPDQTRDARLQVVAEEIQARKLGQARVGLDMDYGCDKRPGKAPRAPAKRAVRGCGHAVGTGSQYEDAAGASLDTEGRRCLRGRIQGDAEADTSRASPSGT